MLKHSWLHSLGLTLGCLLTVSTLYGQPAPALQPGTPARPGVGAPAGPAAGATNIRGRIVRVQGTDQFVVRTPENKEMTFYVNPDTRYMMNNQAAKFTDLRVGAN